MLKKFTSQFLLDLGGMEGEYRAFHLKDDIRQSSFYIVIVIVGIMTTIRGDAALYTGRPDLLLWMILARGGVAFVSILTLIAIRSTADVKVYDRLMLAWLSFVILFLLLFNFTRPANFLTSSYDVILPLAIYIVSPFKIIYSLVL
jgi:hypothetical protein